MTSEVMVNPEIQAKHVFGELTLGEVLPFVEEKCESLVISQDGQEHVYTDITMDEEGLGVWASFNDMEPSYVFPPCTKVRVKDDHIEVLDDSLLGGGCEIWFNEHVSIKIKIL